MADFVLLSSLPKESGLLNRAVMSIVENLPKRSAPSALIVGAAAGIDINNVNTKDIDIYALNSAFFFLEKSGVIANALITGDKRFLKKQKVENFKSLSHLVTFNYDDDASQLPIPATTEIVSYRCLGRDGFSADGNKGFYHGCSSFFFAVQFLVSQGYKNIETLGVKFQPPETYLRIDNTAGQPEFVYHIQLMNIKRMKEFLKRNLVSFKILDEDSNLAAFL